MLLNHYTGWVPPTSAFDVKRTLYSSSNPNSLRAPPIHPYTPPVGHLFWREFLKEEITQASIPEQKQGS